jgi:hypothetical protein
MRRGTAGQRRGSDDAGRQFARRYYATWLAEKHDLRAVLINPAVMAPELLGGLVGRTANFHTGETFEFTPEHVAQLRALERRRVTPARYLLLVETGDEVLDYRSGRGALCRQPPEDPRRGRSQLYALPRAGAANH